MRGRALSLGYQIVYGHQLMPCVVFAASELLFSGGLGPVAWKLQSSEALAVCELQDGVGCTALLPTNATEA